MIYNIRVKLSCKIISLALKIMPKEFRSRKAVGNLMAIGEIK